jgi:pimeloyl-ACP methyl ester carboxylesterase
MGRARVGDVELEYEVRGSGEPVVLIHGAHIAGAFLPLMREPALSDYTLIRYHRRGLAGSSRTGPASIQQQAADCAGLLAQLGVQAAHVVGHSYGGAIALQLALDAPALVHTLALLEPGLLMVPSAAGFFEQLAPVMASYQRGDRASAVDMFLQGVGRPNAREIVERAAPGGFEQAVRDADTFFQVELPALQAWTFTQEDARRITQPILFVLGAESLPLFSEVRELVHAWLPQAQDLLVPGACHFLQMEKGPSGGRGDPGFVEGDGPCPGQIGSASRKRS